MAMSGEEELEPSTGILPPHQLRPFIISPYDRRYRMWETFVVILVFYTAWAFPFQVAFLEKPQPPLSIIDNIVNVLFVIEIVLTFFVAYVDKANHLLVDNPKQIALKYLRTGFLLDVISTVPSYVIAMISPSPILFYDFCRLLNLLRFWRLVSVGDLFSRLEKDIHYNYFLVRCAKLICVTLYCVHCAGCSYYLIAASYQHPKTTWIRDSMDNFFEQNLWTRYVTCLYWSMTTLTTVGYGDLHARDTIQEASGFAQRHKLPARLRRQILEHLTLKFSMELEGLHLPDTLGLLPKSITSSISQHLFYSLIEKVYLFKGVSSDLLFQLVCEMKLEYFPVDDDIILQNQAPTEFYILVTGSVDLVAVRNGLEQVVGEVNRGEICGEIALICSKPQPFTVRSKKFCQMLKLNGTAFLNIVRANVGDETRIFDNFIQHLQEIPAIMEGYLKRGLNESDKKGRTPLHVAASKGKDKCVLLLLNYGVDPNSKDSDGNVPLWEAILGGHQSVARLLYEKGATLQHGDVGEYACIAAEQNSPNLLKDIMHYGGNITLPSNKAGCTALHVAVSRDNVEIVNFLLKQGLNIDIPDKSGWTPQTLAHWRKNSEIKTIFDLYGRGRFSFDGNDGYWIQKRPRRRG